MDFDKAVYNKLHAGKSDAVIWYFGKRKCHLGVGQVEHYFCFWAFYIAKIYAVNMEGKHTFVYGAVISFCATHRYFLSGLNFFCGIARANDCRNTQFATDNGCMTGSSPSIGNNSSGGFHYGFPVGHGGIAYKYLPRLKRREVCHIVNFSGRTAGNLLSHTFASG